MNECQFITFKGLSTTFEASSNVSYNTLRTFVTDINAPKLPAQYFLLIIKP